MDVLGPARLRGGGEQEIMAKASPLPVRWHNAGETSQHRREAVSVQDFHTTTHTVSLEVHQIYESDD